MSQDNRPEHARVNDPQPPPSSHRRPNAPPGPAHRSSARAARPRGGHHAQVEEVVDQLGIDLNLGIKV